MFPDVGCVQQVSSFPSPTRFNTKTFGVTCCAGHNCKMDCWYMRCKEPCHTMRVLVDALANIIVCTVECTRQCGDWLSFLHGMCTHATVECTS